MLLRLTDCTIDLERLELRRGDDRIRLTPNEGRLLRYLHDRPHRVVAKREIESEVWGLSERVDSQTVAVCFRRLRAKVESDTRAPVHLKSVRGKGYLFEPVAASTPQRTNLVPAATAFFGREEGLSQVGEAMARDGFVTLLGPAGVGKTRLAQEFGLHASAFESAWFCDLSGAQTVLDLCGVVCRVLGLAVEADAVRQVTEALDPGTLLILDNFEQLEAEAGPLLTTWVGTGAAVLVTSRRTLRIAGENVIPVQPLALPGERMLASAARSPAARLFEARARAVQPAFAMTEANTPHIVDILEQLDGLPLAIELAAARVRLFPPELLTRRLSERFRILARPSRVEETRQSTLWRALEWSWGLLEPWEQLFLAQCSVFAGPFQLSAAEAVTDLSGFPDAPWPADLVDVLLDNSLLRATPSSVAGTPRFGMLKSIRDFAHAKLGDDDAQTAMRHARHFASAGHALYAEALSGDQHGATQRLDEISADLIEATEAALRAGEVQVAAQACWVALSVIRRRGPVSEGERLAQAVLDRDGLSLEWRVKITRDLGAIKTREGKPLEAIALLRSALELVEQGGSSETQASIVGILASAMMEVGRLDESRALSERCMQLLGSGGNPRNVAVLFGNLGAAELRAGETERARETLHSALALSRSSGHRRMEGTVLGNLGALEIMNGRPGHGQRHLEMALLIHREAENDHAAGVVLSTLADSHSMLRQWDLAAERGAEGLAMHRRVGNLRSEGIALANLGEVALTRGDLDAAADHLGAAIEILRACEIPGALSAALANTGQLLSRQSQPGRAHDALQEADALARTVGDVRALVKVLVARVRLYLDTDDVGAAEAVAAEVTHLIDQKGLTGIWADRGRSIAAEVRGRTRVRSGATSRGS